MNIYISKYNIIAFEFFMVYNLLLYGHARDGILKLNTAISYLQKKYMHY